jgi:hypothetical protein
MSGKASVGKGGSENLKQADGGDGKNILRRAETANIITGGFGVGGVSNIGGAGGDNSRGKGRRWQQPFTEGINNLR